MRSMAWWRYWLMVVERLSVKRQELITMPFTDVAIKVDGIPTGMIM